MSLDADIAANLNAVRARIDAAARRAGRDPGEITLIAVSKTFGADCVRAAWAAGQQDFGENKVQEAEPKHADVARENFARAGLHTIDVRVGKALDTLPALVPLAPFDLVFIDADKPNTPNYFDWAVKLARKGTLIVVDNVVRYGAQDTTSRRKDVRSFMELLADETRVSATIIQTVSIKGHDGFALAVVTGEA